MSNNNKVMRKNQIFIVVNLALIIYLLSALVIEHTFIVNRGIFTDYYCEIIPIIVTIISLVLLIYSLIRIKKYRWLCILPLISVAISFLFRSNILYFILGGWMPGS